MVETILSGNSTFQSSFSVSSAGGEVRDAEGFNAVGAGGDGGDVRFDVSGNNSWKSTVTLSSNGGNSKVSGSSLPGGTAEGRSGNGGKLTLRLSDSNQLKDTLILDSNGGNVECYAFDATNKAGNGGVIQLDITGENEFNDARWTAVGGIAKAFGNISGGQAGFSKVISGNGGEFYGNISEKNRWNGEVKLNVNSGDAETSGPGSVSATGGSGGKVDLKISGGNTFDSTFEISATGTPVFAWNTDSTGEMAGGDGGTISLVSSGMTEMKNVVILDVSGVAIDSVATKTMESQGKGGNVFLANQGNGQLSFLEKVTIRAQGRYNTNGVYGNAGNVTMDFSGRSQTYFSLILVELGDNVDTTGETGNFVINIRDDALVHFSGDVFPGAQNTVMNISGGTLFLGENVNIHTDFYFTEESTLKGKLNVQNDLNLNGKVRLYLTENDHASIDVSQSTSITLGSQANIAFYAENRAALENLEGETILYGNGVDLASLEGSCSTPLYTIKKVASGNDLEVDSIVFKDINEAAPKIAGNAAAVLDTGQDEESKETLAYQFFQEENVAAIRENVSGFTMEALASKASTQIQRMSYMNQMMTQKLTSSQWQRDFQTDCDSSCGQNEECCSGNAMLWASGYGLGGVTREYKGFSRYDYDQYGMMLGADWQNETARFGVYYGYGQSELDGVWMNLKSDDHTFGAYLRWDSLMGGGYSLLLGNYSISDYEAEHRNGDVSFDGSQGSLYFEKGWEWMSFGGGQWNPYLALQYASFTSDGMNHRDFVTSDVDMESLRSIFGLRWNRMFHLELTSIHFSTGLAWHHEFADTEGSFVLQYTESLPGTIRGNGGGRDWCEFNLGVGLALTERVTVSGDYYLFANGATSVHAGMGTVTFEF